MPGTLTCTLCMGRPLQPVKEIGTMKPALVYEVPRQVRTVAAGGPADRSEANKKYWHEQDVQKFLLIYFGEVQCITESRRL